MLPATTFRNDEEFVIKSKKFKYNRMTLCPMVIDRDEAVHTCISCVFYQLIHGRLKRPAGSGPFFKRLRGRIKSVKKLANHDDPTTFINRRAVSRGAILISARTRNYPDNCESSEWLLCRNTWCCSFRCILRCHRFILESQPVIRGQLSRSYDQRFWPHSRLPSKLIPTDLYTSSVFSLIFSKLPIEFSLLEIWHFASQT